MSRTQLNQAGLTLLEIIACVAIVAILATLLYGSYGGFLSSAGNASCIANLRVFHSGFTSYLSDNGHWPQQPDFDTETEAGMQERGKWWIATMNPYLKSPKIWICPSALPALSAQGSIPEGTITYSPTIFDASPNRPYQWSTMPWVVEVGGFHAGGGNVLFPDGSVRSTTDIAESWK